MPGSSAFVEAVNISTFCFYLWDAIGGPDETRECVGA